MSSQFSEQPRSSDDTRPTPEELLDRYHLRDSDRETTSSLTADEVKRPRGRLRVYLGAAAGVGKTYAMLNEGCRRKSRGTDVVVGYVETHGRAQTRAQLGDLEVIPRKKINYRGVTLEEMDTDAVIARHPQVALVDELAHTNVAGSKHARRYQDVMDILDAGIEVLTTLNVQHLESLNDLVESITGVRVRETLPDRVLDLADEVELVDIAPTALRQRMKHGNIYPPERIETALNNFFREGNLTALREIALRLTANKTESQLQRYMTGHKISSPWAATERVLVGFDHRPQSKHIIRDAWRLAHGLDAELIALYVEAEGVGAFLRRLFAFFKYGRNLKQIQEERKRRLEEHALFAEDLGAEVIRLKCKSIPQAFNEVVHQRHITQVVLGQPSHTRMEEFLLGSLTHSLLRKVAGVEFHLVPLKREHRKDPA
jgi:two-component system sensor histidine kinase KdpD